MKRLLVIVSVVMLISGMVWAQGYAGQRGKNRGNNPGAGNRKYRNETCVSADTLSNYPMEALSTTEEEGILLMREEEKLARDVYRALYKKWGLPVFNNISESEQTHTDAVKRLIERYSLADPVGTDVPGVFENRELQELYDQLVARGNTSLVEALKVGATIEDLDIFDLENLLMENDNQDIQVIYQNLIKGSRNHLRSFVTQLARNGESYEAQYIPGDYFSRIVESSRERGPISGPGYKF